MTQSIDRRALLKLGASTAGAALAAPLLDPLAALSAAGRWPSARLPAGAARHVIAAEETSLWTLGAIPTANYIAGPSYLLNWGIPTMDKLDIGRMRRELLAFTQMLLDLSRVPAARLRRLDLRHG